MMTQPDRATDGGADVPVMNVAEAFYAVLRSRGVTTIFGNPGSNELTMLKYLPHDFTYILALQEGAALAMADGFAQASGTVGFVNLHSSSGAGNAVGNLTNSAAGHVPLVILSGQQNRRYIPLGGMLTNVDATRLYDPLVKWSGEPLRPEDTPLLASRALALAQSAPSGPVYLSVPLDDWNKDADRATLDQLLGRTVSGRPIVDDDGIALVVDAIDSAAHPVLVLGPDVDDEEGWAAAVRLAESRSIPVWIAPSPSRAPFPTRHPLLQGLLPTGVGAVAAAFEGHDLVVTFGAAVFRYHQYVEGPYLPEGTALIGVTADPDEATRAPIGTLLVGRASDALRRVAAGVRASGLVEPTSRELSASHAPASHAPASHAPASHTPAAGPFSAEEILDAVDRGRTADSTVVLEWTSADAQWPRLTFDRPESYYFPASGGLGWGLPAAIGIAMARPDRAVVALIGDGAMQYTPAALWTAAHYSIPVTFVICQNGEYGALQRFAKFMEVPDAPYLDVAGLSPVDIATGYGVESHRVDTLEHLEQFVRDAPAATGPRLCVVQQGTMR